VDETRTGSTRLARPVSRRAVARQAGLRGVAVAAAALGVGSIVWYAAFGYSTWMLLLWLGALAAASVYLWSLNRALPQIGLADMAAAAGLAIAFAPIYLISLYRNPIQVSSDEVAVIGVSRFYADAGHVDPFGVSYYLGRPTMLFLAWGRLGNLLGGFDLYHMRLLHALFGLITIAACYALLRQMLPLWWAVFASAVVGACHSMFMISRLAMRENTSILLEVVALALLLWGLRNRSPLVTFWGGAFAGLAFYVYFPSRATFPLWIAFLVVLAFVFRREFPAKRVAVFAATGIAGFVLVASPIVIAEAKVPKSDSNQPQRDSVMLFKLGRDKEQSWMGTSTFWQAYKINVKWGVSAFNNTIVDHGFIYENPNHGFVDPLTGILLWLGFGVVLVQTIRRRGDDAGLLALVSFVILWLSFAFVVNKAPNYTRLLVTLPFVGYFVAQGVRWASGRWRSVHHAPVVLATVTLGFIVAWNLAIAKDFIDIGKRDGDAIGSTGRYLADHKDIPGQKFFIATSDSFPYYSFGSTETAIDRLTLFADSSTQVGQAVDPAGLRSFRQTPPFSLFMTRDMWQEAALPLADRYPRGRIRNVTPDGVFVVLEVPS
jgi:4-amino-4-deoxy-L-arabinose transferase-like glycosyltransferase